MINAIVVLLHMVTFPFLRPATCPFPTTTAHAATFSTCTSTYQCAQRPPSWALRRIYAR